MSIYDDDPMSGLVCSSAEPLDRLVGHRGEVEHLVARRLRPPDPEICEVCGAEMIVTHCFNSGTTEILQACPDGDPVSPWQTGHQYVLTTTPKHAATGCCDIREKRYA